MDERKCDPNYYEQDETEISLLDILLIIAEGKKIIISCILLCLIAGLGYALLLNKPTYVSTMQMAAITQNSPKAGDFNVYVQGNLIAGIIKSNAVLDSVIEKNDLLKGEDGKSKTGVSMRRTLREAIDPEVDTKSGIVTVYVKDRSSQKARAIAQSAYDATLAKLEEMGVILSTHKDAYIETEIQKSIEKIQKYKEQANTKGVNKDLDELMRTLSLFSLYEEGAVYRRSAPMIVQLVSPPSLPDEPMARGRGKIVALSTILGMFLGLTFAFISHFLRVPSSDPETAQKVKRLKELAGFKRDIAN